MNLIINMILDTSLKASITFLVLSGIIIGIGMMIKYLRDGYIF